MSKFFIAAGMLLIALVARPAFAASSLHYTLVESPARSFPKKLVLLPPEVSVREISAGGVTDLVPEWTAQANANIRETLIDPQNFGPDVTLLPAPAFSPEETELIDSYLATYLTVGVAAHWATNFGGDEWAHKRTHFDYTLGDGLSFLREKTGADAAIMVIGEDYVSSSGRKAAMIVGALMGVGIGGGVSVISVGVVDLTNGDILWMHYDQSGTKDLKDKDTVKEMMTTIFSTFPGKGGKQVGR